MAFTLGQNFVGVGNTRTVNRPNCEFCIFHKFPNFPIKCADDHRSGLCNEHRKMFGVTVVKESMLTYDHVKTVGESVAFYNNAGNCAGMGYIPFCTNIEGQFVPDELSAYVQAVINNNASLNCNDKKLVETLFDAISPYFADQPNLVITNNGALTGWIEDVGSSVYVALLENEKPMVRGLNRPPRSKSRVPPFKIPLFIKMLFPEIKPSVTYTEETSGKTFSVISPSLMIFVNQSTRSYVLKCVNRHEVYKFERNNSRISVYTPLGLAGFYKLPSLLSTSTFVRPGQKRPHA